MGNIRISRTPMAFSLVQTTDNILYWQLEPGIPYCVALLHNTSTYPLYVWPFLEIPKLGVYVFQVYVFTTCSRYCKYTRTWIQRKRIPDLDFKLWPILIA